MSVNAVFEASRPDDIDFRLTIGMKLGDWRKVRAAIEKSGEHTHYGALGVVTSAINSMIRQAEHGFTPEKQP